MRTIAGWVTVLLGLIMFGIGIRYHSTLWAGFRTETVVKEVTRTIPQPSPEIPADIPQEKLDKGQFATGPLKIQEAYEDTGKDGKATGVSSGDFQVMDASNKIWMLTLCRPKTGVGVKFKEGSWVNIVYVKEEGCYQFLNATLLKEPK